MKGIEFFAGSRSIGKIADKYDIQVFSTDNVQYGGIDHVEDILKFNPDKVGFIPDFIWLSPPCTAFSVAVIGRNWDKGSLEPKTETARIGVALAKKSVELIKYYLAINPELIWFLENPRGMLRKMPFMQEFKRHTVWYCRYGDIRAKPTDIWTNSTAWFPKPPCHNGNRNCHHEPAPRGSKTGTQGLKGAHERSKIPEELCEQIIMSLFYF